MRCPKHSMPCTQVGTLHVISQQPLADCGNYLFRCKKDGELMCPLCGIVKEKRMIAGIMV